MAFQLQHVLASLSDVEALATAVRKDAAASSKVRCSQTSHCVASSVMPAPALHGDVAVLADVKRDTEVNPSKHMHKGTQIAAASILMMLLSQSSGMCPSSTSLPVIAHAAAVLRMLLCCHSLLVRDRRAAAGAVRRVAYIDDTAQCSSIC